MKFSKKQFYNFYSIVDRLLTIFVQKFLKSAKNSIFGEFLKILVFGRENFKALVARAIIIIFAD